MNSSSSIARLPSIRDSRLRGAASTRCTTLFRAASNGVSARRLRPCAKMGSAPELPPAQPPATAFSLPPPSGIPGGGLRAPAPGEASSPCDWLCSELRRPRRVPARGSLPGSTSVHWPVTAFCGPRASFVDAAACRASWSGGDPGPSAHIAIPPSLRPSLSHSLPPSSLTLPPSLPPSLTAPHPRYPIPPSLSP